MGLDRRTQRIKGQIIHIRRQRVALGVPHAWLEYGNTVYDGVRDRFYTKREYREEIGGYALRCYTVKETAREVVKHGIYGPFDPIFIGPSDDCSTGDEVSPTARRAILPRSGAILG